MRNLNPEIKRIYLIGLMGAGKSTVGKLLAAMRDWTFIDLDQEVEAATGKDISTIFRDEGEERFRDHESRALNQTSDHENTIVACGGGIVTRSRNVAFLQQEYTVWLDLTPAEASRRLKYSSNRPLLSGCDTTQLELETILMDRWDAYIASARIRIDSGESSPESVAANIQKLTGELNA